MKVTIEGFDIYKTFKGITYLLISERKEKECHLEGFCPRYVEKIIKYRTIFLYKKGKLIYSNQNLIDGTPIRINGKIKETQIKGNVHYVRGT